MNKTVPSTFVIFTTIILIVELPAMIFNEGQRGNRGLNK